jgi:DNA polymerase-3 subunit gamma/tau
VVLTDLADFTHLVTRLKFIPDAANDPSLSEIERVQGAEFSVSIPVTALSRIWQMLLKGIPETENASRPFGAAEMVLIRLAHAGSLPSPEEAARRIAGMMNGEISTPPSAPRSNGGDGGSQTTQSTTVGPRGGYDQPMPSRPQGGPTAMLRAVPDMRPTEMPTPRVEPQAEPKAVVKSLADVANLAGENRDMKLKAQVRQFVRPVRLEPGKLEIALSPDAPKSLVSELSTKLKEWTGINWLVILSREPGKLTLVEEDAKQREKNFDDARADPDIAAILARFPGAKVVNVVVHRETETEEELEAAASLEIPEDED